MARETQGSPANEKKLEQYGVWVKVKPRDVTDGPRAGRILRALGPGSAPRHRAAGSRSGRERPDRGRRETPRRAGDASWTREQDLRRLGARGRAAPCRYRAPRHRDGSWTRESSDGFGDSRRRAARAGGGPGRSRVPAAAPPEADSAPQIRRVRRRADSAPPNRRKSK